MRSVVKSYLILAALVASAAAAAVPRQEPGYLETIDVRVVNVEAVVTDRQGIRVPNLKADDFRLFVDGRETPIEFFSEIRGGDVLAGAAGETPSPAVVPGRPLGTSYLVFVDEFFTIAADRRRVLDRLEEELPYLGPDDRMAIVAWDGAELDMLSTWSQSRRDLVDALREAALRPSGGLNRLSELRSFETDRALLSYRRAFLDRPFGSSVLQPEERAYLDLLDRQLENAVTAAAASLRGFASPPGRKVAILLTGGWPDRPADYVVAQPLRSYLAAPGEATLYQPLVETANLLGYTLYPVDVAGIEGDTAGGADRRALMSLDLRNRDYYRERVVHYGLEAIAEETGGEALLNGMRDQALRKVAEDTRSFYWLGFAPQRQADGSEHEIRLEVIPRGLDVRTRTGFVDLTRGQEIDLATESALLFGDFAGAEALDVRVGEGQKSGWGRIEVPLTVSLPLAKLTLLQSDHEWVGDLELRVVARDARGNRSDVALIPVSVSRDALPGRDDVWTFETTLEMRRRDHEMVVALYDKASGELFASSASYVFD